MALHRKNCATPIVMKTWQSAGLVIVCDNNVFVMTTDAWVNERDSSRISRQGCCDDCQSVLAHRGQLLFCTDGPLFVHYTHIHRRIFTVSMKICLHDSLDSQKVKCSRSAILNLTLGSLRCSQIMHADNACIRIKG